MPRDPRLPDDWPGREIQIAAYWRFTFGGNPNYELTDYLHLARTTNPGLYYGSNSLTYPHFSAAIQFSPTNTTADIVVTVHLSQTDTYNTLWTDVPIYATRPQLTPTLHGASDEIGPTISLEAFSFVPQTPR